MQREFGLLRSLGLGCGLLALPACGPSAAAFRPEPSVIRAISAVSTGSVPELGTSATRRLSVLATAANGLSTPRDLEFNPQVDGELWIVNRDTEGVVIVHKAGAAAQRTEARKDSYRFHFMSKVSSIAFGTNENFASCQESRNEGGDYDFMGPTLWSSDLDVFANVNQRLVPGATCRPTAAMSATRELLGSHLDMLHQSPLCMGIAHATGNAFWAFDGDSGDLVYYDFVRDHGPGGDDHSDGRLRRYSDVKLARVTGVPSHMIVDPATQRLYIADTGTGRILRVDPNVARSAGDLEPRGEPLAEYRRFTGARVDTFAAGLRQPSGIAIHDDRLFVSDHATGEIIALSLESGAELQRVTTGATGIMGLAVSAAGQLWYVDGGADKLVRVDAE